MAKLILSMDGLVLKEVQLEQTRLTIGRKAHNDIQIDNLAISGEHAAVVTILNDSFLEDLNSTNGTLVNGQPIKKHVLRNNDIIELGKYSLKYVADTNLPVEVDLARSMTASRSSTDSAIRSEDLRIEEDAPRSHLISTGIRNRAEAARLGVIQVLNGPNVGKELELMKNITTLGKPGVQVAVIARRPAGYFVTHVEGATFPTVNGQPIDAQGCQLTEHDVLEIAGVKMGFYLRD